MSIGSPPNDLSPRPAPNTYSKVVRGAASRASQTLARPVRLLKFSWLCPRRNHACSAEANPTAATAATSTAQAKNRRAAALVSMSEPIASASPMSRPSVAVRVWVRASRTSDGTMTSAALVRSVRRPRRSSTVSPMITAAYWPICGGVSGHNAPTSRPP